MDKPLNPKKQTILDAWHEHALAETQFVITLSGKDFDFSVQNAPDPDDPDPDLLGVSVIANTPIAADVIRLAFLYHTSVYRGHTMVFHNMENDRPLAMIIRRDPILKVIATDDVILTVPTDPKSLQTKLFEPLLETLVYRANSIRTVYRKLNIVFDDSRTYHLDNQEFYNTFIHPTMEVIS